VPRELALSDRRQTHPLTGSVHQANPNCTERPDPERTQNRLIKSTKLPLHKTTQTLALKYREFCTEARPIHIDRNGLRLRYYIFQGGTNRTSAPLAIETNVPVRLLGAPGDKVHKCNFLL
jgi:hypothetical protein